LITIYLNAPSLRCQAHLQTLTSKRTFQKLAKEPSSPYLANAQLTLDAENLIDLDNEKYKPATSALFHKSFRRLATARHASGFGIVDITKNRNSAD
jgi:hypothetical protein